MKIFVPLLFVAVAFPTFAFADADVHFASDGTFSATGLTVFQKSGSDLFSRATWGQTFIRLVVLANASTTITKSHGEAAGIGDISENDTIDVNGTLQTGGDSIIINATSIHDDALETASKTLSGTVQSINTPAQTFVLANKMFGTTTISVANTTQITQGVRTISFADIVVGNKITSVSGTYDYVGNTLAADSVVVYQDPSVFLPRNFQGTLKSISGTQLPVTLVVTVGSTDYSVFLAQGSSILNNAKASASLSRFVVGDTVRFYGSIRQSDLTQVDAQILRDLNF